MGEKYRHFFIDEFQDTSKMQWENLIPLIDNALSQQTGENQGNLLLVGDAKQSIYRWRGGLPEQFMELYRDGNPFSIQDKKVKHLPKNYRSCKEIVDFNNDFFTFTADYFAEEGHASLYKKGNRQQPNDKEGGYVKFEFIEKQKKAVEQEVYCQLVHETILDVKNNGFSESDICILTRKKADGIVLGAYLMERDIQVISQETLLLQSSALVQMLVLSLVLSLYPSNEEAKINLLDLLHDHLGIQEEKHTFFMRFLNSSPDEFSKTLEQYGVDFNFKKLQTVSLYEGFEYCIQQFKLAEAADAYLFGFMDLVYEFEQQPLAGKIAFLDYWETKRESASIAAAEGTNAVQIMTIHKAKGLEFPVVIFPFADIELYKTQNDTLWYPLDQDEFDFDEAQVNFNKQLAEYSEIGEQMYNSHRSQLELDNINLLYVTLTRAVEKLYIFAEMPKEPKDGIPLSYNHLFMAFLKHKSRWNETQMIYEFGKNGKKISKERVIPFQVAPEYISSNPKEHSLKIVSKEALLWETKTEVAITAGNILHGTMAQIFTKEDTERVLEELKQRAILTQEELKALKQNVHQIINHPELAQLFDGSSTVYNERDIITAKGRMLRPDRINIYPDDSVIITDYKTGGQSESHKTQLASYAQALREMGFKIQDSMLVYCSDSVTLWKSSDS
jgi:ATP-dependent exoDNAse (exonuclease V) beta subunit